MTAEMEAAIRGLHPLIQRYIRKAFELSGERQAWEMIDAWTKETNDASI